MMFILFYYGFGCITEALYSHFVGDDFLPEDSTTSQMIFYKFWAVWVWPISFAGLLLYFLAEAINPDE